MAARRRTEAPAPADWDSRDPPADGHSGQDTPNDDTAADEARAADEEDEADDEDAGPADDESLEADLAARSTVDHDAEGIAPGAVQLTDRQRAGLDPTDPATHVRQAEDRSGLSNMQTDHEALGGLDAISGTPNAGVTEDVRHSAPGLAGASDHSGRAPLPDPFANVGAQGRDALGKLREASKAAHDRGKPQGQGWLSLQQLGAHKAVMDGLVESGHVHQNVRPGGHFSPDTGTVYRVAGHDKAA